MQNLFDDLRKLLSHDDRFMVEGNLLKNKIVESALRSDKDLLKILLSDENLRKHFFQPVDEIFVFDKVKFQKFISNKSFLPDSYTSFKNKIGLTAEDDFISENKEVVLSWPYKDCILEGGQTKEDTRRNEIFWNEILAPDQVDRLLSPKAFVNFKRFGQNGEHPVKEFSKKDNLIIKGNNLLALYSIKKVYAGQVKVIYIDPPYNTGADSFSYNDKFNHSTWLTFMRNRLSAAKSLLNHDGVILVQCSFHEYAYLKVLMDELFKKHLCTFNIQVRHPDRILTGDKEYNDVIEYILIYSDNPLKKLPKKSELKTDNDYIFKIKEKGKGEELAFDKKKVIVLTPDKYEKIVCPPGNENLKTISIRGSIREKNSSGRFYVKHLESLKNNYPPETLFKVPDMGDDSLGFRYFYSPPEGNINGGYYQGKPQSSDTTYKPYPNFFNFEKEYNNVAGEGSVSFRNGKKPEELLKFLLGIFADKNDIILDYHLGSGTTAAVAHKLGITYIGIEQLDYGKNDSVIRLQNVINGDVSGISDSVDWNGGGSFVYLELAKANEAFSEQIRNANHAEELEAIKEMIFEKAFLSYKIDPKIFDKTATAFSQLSFEDKKRFLSDALDKNMLYVPFSEMADETYGISENDRKLSRKFYELK
jgi:adenine-specific DNA-methyltransferase